MATQNDSAVADKGKRANTARMRQGRMRPEKAKKATAVPSPRRPGGGGARRASRLPPLAECVPTLLGRDIAYGTAVIVALADRHDEEVRLNHVIMEEVVQRPGAAPKRPILDRADSADLARLLGGLSHPDRIRIAKLILGGASSHRQLSAAAKLRTGPLYHHLRGLEHAGILAKASRNLYTITQKGRVVLFVAAALAGFGSGRRSPWCCSRIICGRSPSRRRTSRPRKRPRPARPSVPGRSRNRRAGGQTRAGRLAG